jgi:2-methylisocitrate lyase-like PEP mutase family enzyme
MSAAAHQARSRLRALLPGPGLVVVPGVATALHARLATAARFDVLFATGSGIANTIFGFPDLGLLSMREVVDMTRHIVEATHLPVIADADTGYGNHLNVVRTTREMEHAGVAAIVIEDQVSPKRCGHFDGKAVVLVREMVEKIIAATRSREDPEMVIVARSDAIAVEGVDATIERARLYVAAGADVIFIEAPRTNEDIRRIPREVPAPCLLNIVEGGKTPLLPAQELEDAGYRFALHANLALRVSSAGVEEAFAALRRDRSSEAMLDRLQSWEGRQTSVDLAGWQSLDSDIAEAARAFLEREHATDNQQETADGIA